MASCLGCNSCGWRFGEIRVVTEPSLSLSPLCLRSHRCHCQSPFLDVYSQHVPLSQLCVCSHRYHCQSDFLAFYSQWEQELWASTWLLATAQTTNMAASCSRATDPDQAFRGSPDHRHQHGLRWQHRPLTSACLLAAAQPSDIKMLSEYSTDPSCSRTTDPDMALRGSMGPDITMALGGNAGHSGLYGCSWPLGLQTSAWIVVAAETMGICFAFGDTWATDINTDATCCRTTIFSIGMDSVD